MSYRKMLYALIILLTLIFVACEKTTDPKDITLNITNSTNETIKSISIRINQTEEWGTNYTAGDSLSHGASKTITLPSSFSPGTYDIQLISRANNCYTKEAVDLKKGKNDFTFNTPDVVEIFIENNTYITLTEAQIKHSSDPETAWSVDLLSPDLTSPNSGQLNLALWTSNISAGKYDLRLKGVDNSIFTKIEVPLNYGRNNISFDYNDKDMIVLKIKNMTRPTIANADSIFALISFKVAPTGTVNWNSVPDLSVEKLNYGETRTVYPSAQNGAGNYDIRVSNYAHTNANNVFMMTAPLTIGTQEVEFTADHLVSSIAMTITNNTGVEIWAVNMRTPADSVFITSNNLLTNNASIPHGTSRSIYLPASSPNGVYGVRLATLATGAGTTFTKDNASLSIGNNALIFTDSDIDRFISFRILNNTGLTAETISIKLSSSSSWPTSAPNFSYTALENGATRIIYLGASSVPGRYDVRLSSERRDSGGVITASGAFYLRTGEQLNIGDDNPLLEFLPSHLSTIGIRIFNNTGLSISRAFIKLSSATNWGTTNLFPTSTNFTNGSTPRVIYLADTFNNGVYDIQLSNSDNATFNLTNVQLTRGEISDATFTANLLINIALNIVNNTQYTTNALEIKPAGNNTNWEVVSRSGLAPGGDRTWYLLPTYTTGTYDIRIKSNEGAIFEQTGKQLRERETNDIEFISSDQVTQVPVTITNNTDVILNQMSITTSDGATEVFEYSTAIAQDATVTIYFDQAYSAGNYNIRLSNNDGVVFMKNNVYLSSTSSPVVFTSEDQTTIALTITNETRMPLNQVHRKRSDSNDWGENLLLVNTNIANGSTRTFYLPMTDATGTYNIRVGNTTIGAYYTKTTALAIQNDPIIFEPEDLSVVSFIVDNQTSLMVNQLYIKLSSETVWGTTNLFNSSLVNGLTRTIYLPQEYQGGTYDIQLRSSDGNTYIKQNQALTTSGTTPTITFYPSDKQNQVFFIIENRTGNNIINVNVKKSNVTSWEDSLVVAYTITIPNRQNATLFLPSSYSAGIYDIQLCTAATANEPAIKFTKTNQEIVNESNNISTFNFTENDCERVTITITNATRLTIATVRARRTGTTSWSTLSGALSVDATGTFYFPAGSTSDNYDVELTTPSLTGGLGAVTFTKQNLALTTGNTVLRFTNEDCSNRLSLSIFNDSKTQAVINSAYVRVNGTSSWSANSIVASDRVTIAPDDSLIVYLPSANSPNNYDVQLRFHTPDYFAPTTSSENNKSYIVYNANSQTNTPLINGRNYFTYTSFTPDPRIAIQLTNNTLNPIGGIFVKLTYPTPAVIRDIWGSNLLETIVQNGASGTALLPSSFTSASFTVRARTVSGVEFIKENTTLNDGSNSLTFDISDLDSKYTRFANAYWRILDDTSKPDRILIAKMDLLDDADGVPGGRMKYANTYTATTWENSSIRSFLNDRGPNGYLGKLGQIAPADTARIKRTLISNQPNQWHATNAGNDTYDYIFLLSIHEAIVPYCSGHETDEDCAIDQLERGSTPTGFISDKDDVDRIGYIDRGGSYVPTGWWLRSPGNITRNAAFINAIGNVNMDGTGVDLQNHGAGIRPALWLSR